MLTSILKQIIIAKQNCKQHHHNQILSYLDINKFLMDFKILFVIYSLFLVVDANPVIKSFEDQWNYTITSDKTPILGSESAREERDFLCTVCDAVAKTIKNVDIEGITNLVKKPATDTCYNMGSFFWWNKTKCDEEIDKLYSKIGAINFGKEIASEVMCDVVLGDKCKVKKPAPKPTTTRPSSNSSKNSFNFLISILLLVFTKIITVMFLHF